MAMNINFDKTDRLIQIIDEAVRVLNSAEYNLGRAFKLAEFNLQMQQNSD